MEYYTKYILLTPSEYFTLNEAISKAMGWDLGNPKGTDRYRSMNCQLDENGKCIMSIDAWVQEEHPELLTGFTLVDSYVAGATSKNIEVSIPTEKVDWTLRHYEAVGDKSISMIKADSSRSTASDKAVEGLKSNNITIVTADTTPINQYVTITDGSKIVASDYLTNAKIETNLTVEKFDSLNSITATKLENLPSTVGTWIEKKMYNYNGKTVLCLQPHKRTIYAPETTPALFSFYRENTGTLAWIENEKVSVGWERTYGGKTYVVTQAHLTLSSWTPDKATTLWSLKPSGSAWAYPVAYRVNDEVTYSGKTYACIQAHTSNVSWTPTATINVLWKLK